MTIPNSVALKTLWGTPAPTDDTPGSLTRAGRQVWEALRWFARGTGACWARIQTISARTGLATRTVQKWLTRLAAWGWIQTRRRGRLTAIRTRTAAAPCALACALKPAGTTCPEERQERTMAHGPSAAGPRIRNLPSLTPMDLRDAHRMREVLGGVLGAYKAPGQAERADDPRTLLRWFGWAHKALRTARSPGAMFRWLASTGSEQIAQIDEERARESLALVLHGQRTRRAPQRDAAAEANGEYDE